MSERPVDSIDEQMNTLRGLNVEAEQMLTSVRQQQAELERHELNILSAIDGRRDRMDSLLDERLRAAQADGMVKV